VQVVDAVAFFQHAGVVFADDSVARLSACRTVVQVQQRMVHGRVGELHAALAAVVKELAGDWLVAGSVEVRSPQQSGVMVLLPLVHAHTPVEPHSSTP
jgi:hypothetical protein